jgi:hypothetical protein
VSKRIALLTVVLLLLVQAVPVFACVAMPSHALTTCCCEPDQNCTMASRAGGCAVPEACCVQASGSTPALSVAASHADNRPVAALIAIGPPPSANDPLGLINARANRIARIHLDAPPLAAVPLYLLHLRLTL